MRTCRIRIRAVLFSITSDIKENVCRSAKKWLSNTSATSSDSIIIWSSHELDELRNRFSSTWSTSSRKNWLPLLTDWIQLSGCSTHRRCRLDGDCRNRIQIQLPGRGPCSPMHGRQQPLIWHSSPGAHQIHVSTATLNRNQKKNINIHFAKIIATEFDILKTKSVNGNSHSVINVFNILNR